MSTLLYRLGRRAALRPLVPLVSWLLVILAVVALLATQTPSISTSLTLDDAPAQQVLDEFRDYVGKFWLVKPKAASIESLADSLRRAA